MKKIYALLSILLLTGSLFSQNVNISWDQDYSQPYNGEEVTITGGDNSLYTNFYVKNLGPNADFIWRRDILSISSQTFSDQLCDDQICYTPSGNPWVCPAQYNLNQGDSSLFQPKLLTNGVSGTAHIRYFILDVNENKLDSVDVIFTSTVNVKEESLKIKFDIYPNPSKSSVTIDVKGKSDVVFMDALGKNVLSTSLSAPSNKIDITSLKNGVYFVQVISENGVRSETKKLIVQK